VIYSAKHGAMFSVIHYDFVFSQFTTNGYQNRTIMGSGPANAVAVITQYQNGRLLEYAPLCPCIDSEFVLQAARRIWEASEYPPVC
jgi:hypothetical protein